MRRITGILSRCTFLANPVTFLTRSISVVERSASHEGPATFRDVNVTFGAKRFLHGSLSTRLSGRGNASGHNRHARSVVANVLVKRFSSQANGEQGLSQVAESNRLRFAKYLVLCMMVALGVKVLPSLGQSSVEHTLMLMEAQQPFWQKSGIDRARVLASTDAGIAKLLRGGVAQRLVSILEDKPDPENVSAALHTIEELSRKYEAREALVLAGVTEALRQIAGEDAANSELARQLLIVYTVQENHVD